MMITSLSDPNQNLKMEPLDSENQKSNLSLEPDRQGTRQECGRFLEQAQKSQRTSQDRPLEKSHASKPQISQENQAYSFEKEVEKQTREQHKSDRWHQERKFKLTSSRFGEICKLRKYDLKYCESLSTNQKDLSHIPAVKFGLNQENVALEQFKQRMRFDVVKKARFFISKAYPHSGSSSRLPFITLCAVSVIKLRNISGANSISFLALLLALLSSFIKYLCGSAHCLSWSDMFNKSL